METANQRLKAFINYLGISITGLAETLKTSQPTMSAIVNGHRNISRGMLARLGAAYPDLNTVWLLTGEGEMLTTDTAPLQAVDIPEPQADTPEQRELDMLRQMLADRDATIAHLNRHIGAITSQLDTLLAIHTPTDTPTDDFMA